VRAGVVSSECVVQERATGMLDAILLASAAAGEHEPSHVWVTWCDQVAVDLRTVRKLASLTASRPRAELVMPTVHAADPYIHLDRDADGRIVRVLHKREGDAMPADGESDMGLFALSAAAYFEQLPAYARETVPGSGTGERNFLPFIPWIAARGTVLTFPAHDPMEAIGINTPADLRRVEAYLSER
jgi:bifunctional N-acetylglucosamine-1-phosphate-uridyltransferase/glucosamine-1-phosphate-acetyltransferase GlmU-like protein